MVGTLALLAWTLVTSGLVFASLSKCGVLRISEKAEESGVDVAEHMALISLGDANENDDHDSTDQNEDKV
eukprot:SAG31_NODE_4663_length_3057_cov_4.247126_3_plen_70_part_00